MAQLFEDLSCKTKGSRFDVCWCHWDFSLTNSFQPHYEPGVDPKSNRYDYQGYSWKVKAAGA